MIAPSLADRIAALPKADRIAFYRRLPPGALAAKRYSPELWADGVQRLPPPGDLASVELITGGRRRGKTQFATWLFLREWISGRYQNPRLVASTEGGVLQTVLCGRSGVWTWMPREQRMAVGNDIRRAFIKSRSHAGVLEIPGLPPVICLSAEKPGNAIGQGSDLTLADDPAAWIDVCGVEKAAEMLRQLRVSTSEGPSPCLIIPTTLRGDGFLRRLFQGSMTGVRKRNLGATTDNTRISKKFKDEVIEDMRNDGDDWAATELDGVERDDTAGALWKRAWIQRVPRAPQLARVVVGVDPADDGRKDSDETGIVVLGLGTDSRLYVLADYTARWTAEHWPAVVAWAFRQHRADAIVAEMNRARSLVKRCIRIESPNVPVMEADATRGKATRAEPLSMLYRDGQVSHVIDGPQLSRAGHLVIEVPVFNPATGRRDVETLLVKRNQKGWTTLEDELCGWVPRMSRSPNGLDALVWAAWHLRSPDEGAPEDVEDGAWGDESRYAGILADDRGYDHGQDRGYERGIDRGYR